MAVALAFRLAIATAIAGHRVIRWAQGPGVDAGSRLSQALLRRLEDASESDGALTDAVGAETGTMADVTTFTGGFELRKAQVRWGRSSGAAAGTDDAVTTHHFAKVASGSVVNAWVEADFTAAESALLAFWNAIKANWPNEISYKQVRWYKVVPGTAANGPPVRVIDPNIVGGSAGGAPLSPQTAISFTEKTTDAKAWGRFYLPPPIAATLNPDTSRLNTAIQGLWADEADTMYQAFLTAGIPAVVFSSAKPSRPTASGGTLPASVARALTVDQVQVDDLTDVIRSRRWNEPLLRIQRDIN